ncbi:hypothetical protein BDV26DRAFT_282021 [Aspergillus bertholletiae]|uniref:Uncharacterized protein n=1 Tax=Aspergillus bertholletiae TaxID=1226010 RepID=A0A5N7B4Z8_9EURO|nr:hypothetical protein BDV26DRAFT_282021 [Aspergillus bertholletiae]
MTVRMPPTGISPEDPKRNQLFLAAIEVLFERYPQWHVVVFVLTELCGRSQSVETEQVWTVIENAVERWTRQEFQKGEATLKPVYHLMERAAVAHAICSYEEEMHHDYWFPVLY